MSETKKVKVDEDIFARNDSIALSNRAYFNKNKIFCINLVSSPGSGKTSLLEKTLSDLKKEIEFFVIEGDLQTEHDADRIRTTGVKAYQINTDGGCHLDANMIMKAIKNQKKEVKKNSILFIENVGNLVCPSYFDLGEHKRVVIISVAEGDDKPAKYPNMFESSDLCIINKIDLLDYVDFDLRVCEKYIKQINPNLPVITLSTKSRSGLEDWYKWLKGCI